MRPRDGWTFVIELADTRIGRGDKVPHRCPFHDDQNPSAVTFLEEGGRSFTFCSACGAKAWGTYEIFGGGLYVTVGNRPTGQKAIRSPASPQKAHTRAVGTKDPSATAKRLWFAAISREIPPRPSSNKDVRQFWEEYLTVKGVNVERMSDVEMPPILFDLGIWFPAMAINPAGQIFSPSAPAGVVRSIPYKSLNFFRSDPQNAYAYIPSPSALSNPVVVFESPVVALRVAVLGWHSVVAALGTGDRVIRNLRSRYRVVVVRDPHSGKIVEADNVSDVDKLSDEKVALLMRGIF